MYIIQGSRETRLHKYRPIYLTPELTYTYRIRRKKCGSTYVYFVELCFQLQWNSTLVCSTSGIGVVCAIENSKDMEWKLSVKFHMWSC